MISEQTKQRIIDAADVQDVLSDFLDLKKKGTRYECCCPFHSERTPSFSVNPRTNRWHCFGCGADGDSIEFLMRHQNMSFPEALEWLAKRYHIEVRYDRKEQSEQELEESRRRESAFAALDAVQRFYVEQFNTDNPEAEAARRYAYDRWGEDFCKESGIGYAPKGNLLIGYAKQKGLSMQLLIDLGVIRKGEDGNEYVLLRERVTIPIRNRWRRVVAFTARYIGADHDKPKYMNSPESFLYSKKQTLFGIDVAARAAKQSNCFIVVEGAPDVLRLQSIGLTEAVAPLGTALTVDHLGVMKRICKTIRFIPDSDPPKGKLWGAGVIAVMKHGEEAIRQGFDAYVREIPHSKTDDDNEVKYDPDSYIVNREAYSALDDKHFLIWLGEKRFAANNTADANFEALRDIAELLILLDDDMIQEMCIDSLSKMFGKPKQWRDAMKRAGKKATDKAAEEAVNKQFSPKELALMHKFGIVIRNNMYYGPSKEGELERWSNFIMIPHFHIKNKTSVRKFTLINEYGQQEVLAIPQGKFTSVQNFTTEIEKLGNFVWLAKQDKFNKIKEFLYAMTDSLNSISILGWQEKEKVYAFADGLHDGERFYPIDAQGMVNYGGDKFYLPAFDETNAKEQEGYDFEKKIAYMAGNEDSLYEFVERLIAVFGDGAKVGFAWVLACIFRDHIFKFKDWFPIFNLFGIRSSGKSALASALNSFFYPLRQDPAKLGNTSVAAITYMLDHINNGVVVLDEYTNLLNDRVVDLLKGLFGGTTNTRKNMNDTEKGICTGKVLSGVILCGQHLPTKDSALFTRCVLQTYFRTSFSDEENIAFVKLKEVAKLGNAHHTMSIMRHRDAFVENYADTYALTRKEIKARFVGEQVDDRIIDNWVAILAAFRVLETYISVPFTYANLFDISIGGIRHQAREAGKTSETADFWEMVNALHMNGKIFYDSHFAIVSSTSFTPQKDPTKKVTFTKSTKLLYLNWPLLKELLRLRPGLNQMKMDLQALENYLRNCPQFLGSRQRRFVRLNSLGAPDVTYENNVKKQAKSTMWAMVFEYEQLKNATNIDLETSYAVVDDSDDDAEDNAPAEAATPPPAQVVQATLFSQSKTDDVLPF